MAYLFTLLFVVTAYVTPTVLFGPLAEYRIEVVLVMLAIVTSIPNIARSRMLALPQTWGCIGLTVIIPLTLASEGLVSGALPGLYGFMVVALCFMFAAANFQKQSQLAWTVFALLVCSTYFIANGVHDLYANVIPSNFLYGDGTLRRLRGLGVVFDPNDLAQVLVSLIPLVFLWKSKNRFPNVFLVGIPIAVLVTGMFYTHSRGSAVALAAMMVVTLRRKIGTVPAALLAGCLFAASLAVGWSGGRDVSMDAGADRLDAWSTGLEFIKQHPFIGVGYSRFADFNDITAHNSVVVCAAEIGIPGFLCWILLLFSSIRAGIKLSAPAEMEEGASEEALTVSRTAADWPSRSRPAVGKFPTVPAYGTRIAMAGSVNGMRLPWPGGSGLERMQKPFGRTSETELVEDTAQQEEIRRMARLMLASLTGFLTAGWFLSRAFSPWLFLYCGMMAALVRMAEKAGIKPKLDSFSFLVRWSVIIGIALMVLLYITLKVRRLTGK